jgi:uncharacterized protein (UPF0332 family)
MMVDQVEKLVQLRLRQAQESLAEAKTLFDVDLWRGTINRSYYAMFYAVLALAVQRQVITSKHSGLITFFDREFVKPGVFPKELSKAIHLAFQRRQEHDYGDVFAVSQVEAEQAYGEARSFVDAIAQHFDAES